jgi:hypothetical protein
MRNQIDPVAGHKQIGQVYLIGLQGMEEDPARSWKRRGERPRAKIIGSHPISTLLRHHKVASKEVAQGREF